MFQDTSLQLVIQSLPLLLKSTWMTLQIAILSMAAGGLGGLVLGLFNCRKLRSPWIGHLLNGFVYVMRGTPLFVQVLIVYYGLPEMIGFTLSPLTAGVLALGLNSTAYISEIVRSGIDAIADGQWEASYVLGFTRMQTLQGIILPQMFQITLPSLTNELTALIKETSILMVIGVTELTKTSRDIVSRELDPMAIYITAAFLYLLMTTSVSLMAKRLQKGASHD